MSSPPALRYAAAKARRTLVPRSGSTRFAAQRVYRLCRAGRDLTARSCRGTSERPLGSRLELPVAEQDAVAVKDSNGGGAVALRHRQHCAGRWNPATLNARLFFEFDPSGCRSSKALNQPARPRVVETVAPPFEQYLTLSETGRGRGRRRATRPIRSASTLRCFPPSINATIGVGHRDQAVPVLIALDDHDRSETVAAPLGYRYESPAAKTPGQRWKPDLQHIGNRVGVLHIVILTPRGRPLARKPRSGSTGFAAQLITAAGAAARAGCKSGPPLSLDRSEEAIYESAALPALPR